MSKRREGFTLVELLLTLGVLAIGLVSIFTLLPGISSFSRNIRDTDRMQTFADAVFDSMEWSLTSSENPGIITSAEKQTFYHILGTQALEVTSSELPWPVTNGVEDFVPVFFYTLELQTNSVNQVLVRLTVRPDSRLEEEAYTKILYPQVEEW